MAISSPVLKDVSITLSWLSSVSVPYILKSLATRLPENLQTLRLEWASHMSGGDKSDALWELLESQKSVRSLWLCGGGDMDVKRVEALRTFDNLTKLSLSIHLHAVDQASPTLLQVTSLCPQLTVFRAFIAAPPYNTKQIHLVAISPLLSLNHLVHLEIHGPPINMQREDIANMGKSWPYLNTLTIEGASQFTSEPSLSQLPIFAEAFGRTLLCLELDLSCDEVPSEATLPDVKFPNLKYLGVGTQPLPTGRSVAISRLLAKICTKARIVPSLASDVFPEKSDWTTIATLVKSFQSQN